MDIVVSRFPGDLPGNDIVEPLLADAFAAIARGTAELDAQEPVIPVTMDCVYQAGVRDGDIAHICDELRGNDYRAKITGVTISARKEGDGWIHTMRLNLERPKEKE